MELTAENTKGFKTLIDGFVELVPPAVVVNTIYRNINSGENTVAYHKEPFSDSTGSIRYNGYGKPKGPLVVQPAGPLAAQILNTIQSNLGNSLVNGLIPLLSPYLAGATNDVSAAYATIQSYKTAAQADLANAFNTLQTWFSHL